MRAFVCACHHVYTEFMCHAWTCMCTKPQKSLGWKSFFFLFAWCPGDRFPLRYMRKDLWWQLLLFGTCEMFLCPSQKTKAHQTASFLTLLKANKYPDFLKPLKSVAKYWEHKEVLEKWYEWQPGSKVWVPKRAFSVCTQADREGWHH